MDVSRAHRIRRQLKHVFRIEPPKCGVLKYVAPDRAAAEFFSKPAERSICPDNYGHDALLALPDLKIY
jgi:hypothetical protein